MSDKLNFPSKAAATPTPHTSGKSAKSLWASSVGAKRNESVLLLGSAKEVQPLSDALKTQMSTLVCRDIHTFRAALKRDAEVALVYSDGLDAKTLTILNATLATPLGVDLPVLWLERRSSTAPEAVAQRKQVLARPFTFVLEQPLTHVTLLSAVRLALQVRQQQYVLRDLTARLKAFASKNKLGTKEIVIRAESPPFGAAFYASPVPSAVTTLSEGRYVDINQSALDLMEMTRGEVKGQLASDLSLLERLPWTRAEMLEHLHISSSLRDVPISYRTKTGALREGLASFERIKVGGESCLLSMVLDVTERRQNEKELMRAVQEVMSDTEWFSRSFVEKLAQVRSVDSNLKVQAEIKDLTPREQQVMTGVAKGHSNEDIAADLGLSPNTVRNYLANAFSKLDLHSRADAVVWARQRGLQNGR